MSEQELKRRRSKFTDQKLDAETKEILLYRLRKRKYVNYILLLIDVYCAPKFFYVLYKLITESYFERTVSHFDQILFFLSGGFFFISIFFIVGNIYEIKTIKKIVYEVKLILVHYGTVNYINPLPPIPIVSIDRLQYTATFKEARKIRRGMYVEYKYASLEPIPLGSFWTRKPKIFISLKEIK